jgi:hypothetical protein
MGDALFLVIAVQVARRLRECGVRSAAQDDSVLFDRHLLDNGFSPALAARSYATVAVADHLPVPLEDEFAFGLELIIDGLARLVDRQRP